MQPYGAPAGGGGGIPVYTPGLKTQTLNLDYNIAALAGYLFWPIAAVIAFTEPKEPQRAWVRFHAIQALILDLGALVFINVVTVILAMISSTLAAIGSLLYLGWLVVMILNVVKAHKGEHMNLGPISAFAASKA